MKLPHSLNFHFQKDLENYNMIIRSLNQMHGIIPNYDMSALPMHLLLNSAEGIFPATPLNPSLFIKDG